MAAESVGLAASVAGLVSLGLQVTGGILKYVDAFESREQDLALVRQQNEALRTTLQVIEEYVVAHGLSPELAATVSRSMQSFEKALERIESLYPDLVDSGGKSWTSRLGNRKRRFTYPFNRSKVQELGRQLETARGTLQLTLNALDMRISRQNHAETLSAMEVSFRGLSSETQLIRSGLAAVEAPIVDIRDQISTTHEAINASTQLLVSQYGALSYQTQESNQVLLKRFQETSNIVQRLAEICSKQQQEAYKQHQETIKTIERLARQTQKSYAPDHAPVALVRRLADKPALLNEAGNAMRTFERPGDQLIELDFPTKPLQNSTQISASVTKSHVQTILGRICICPRQRSVRERKGIQLGGSSFFGHWETETHWDACPLSRASSKKRRVVMGFNYTGLAQILNTAINMSFALTYGAGGFSISPSFACNPTVDDKLDPAFRIVDLIGEGFYHLSNGPENLMLACMKRLIRLFDEGKVCPTAVNEGNETLLHLAIRSLSQAVLSSSRGGFDGGGLFIELVQTLISYGIAPFAYDTYGLSPMLEMYPYMFGLELVQPVLDVLLRANLESQPVAVGASSINGETDVSIPTSDVKSIYEISPGFAEACECGPLSMAVIQNDTMAVSRILSHNPKATTEINIYGQSPLHLAATNPWILDILLSAGDRSVLDRCDISGFTALEIAMIHSSNSCINATAVQRCYVDECDCCQCIDLFLAAGCSVRMHKLDGSHRPNAPELYSILGNASELARRKYVFHMRKCRTAIKSPHQRGSIFAPDGGDADDLSWIFNEIADPHLGALFYRHGFQPQPSCLINLRWEYTDKRDTMNLAYLHWLVSHGVDILFRSPKGPALLDESPNRGLFGAHFAYHFIELDFRQNLLERQRDDSWEASMELTEAIFRRDLTDGCQCHCTADGCTPFTWMMKGNVFLMDSTYRSLETPGRYACFLSSHYSQCGPELATLTYKAAIRYATFTALNTSHTCCGAWNVAKYGRDRVQRDANEMKTINEKQATLLETLENLVLEFEEKAVEYLETDSKSGRRSFHRFWSAYWEVRMNEELAKFHDKKSKAAKEKSKRENEIRGWGPQRPVEKKNPYKSTDLKYYLYELDKICPDYSEPWPEESFRVSKVA